MDDTLIRDEWECSAYGPGGLAHGAACFIAGGSLFARVCPSAVQCRAVMAAERMRVWKVIQEQAAAGDADCIFLAAEFSSPDMLLSGYGNPPDLPCEDCPHGRTAHLTRAPSRPDPYFCSACECRQYRGPH